MESYSNVHQSSKPGGLAALVQKRQATLGIAPTRNHDILALNTAHASTLPQHNDNPSLSQANAPSHPHHESSTTTVTTAAAAAAAAAEQRELEQVFNPQPLSIQDVLSDIATPVPTSQVHSSSNSHNPPTTAMDEKIALAEFEEDLTATATTTASAKPHQRQERQTSIMGFTPDEFAALSREDQQEIQSCAKTTTALLQKEAQIDSIIARANRSMEQRQATRNVRHSTRRNPSHE